MNNMGPMGFGVCKVEKMSPVLEVCGEVKPTSYLNLM
jgi:hypothetical protein